MNFDKMLNMINFRVYIWPKSMLKVSPGMKCCIIQSMSSIIEFISLNIQITKSDIESVTKRERAICGPECFKIILNSERVTCLFLRFTMGLVIAFTDI